MAKTAMDLYLGWLRDAHAMEKQALILIDTQIPRMGGFPEMKARLQKHRTETEAQLLQIERLLARHGSSASVVKDVAGSAMAGSQALGGLFTSDIPVKGAQTSFTFENYEIATYRTLIAAAELCRDTTAIPVLERILEEEMQMADWLEGHLEQMSRRYMHGADAMASGAVGL
jgi:ferritin-like metal-binding protein YciE